jgi:uncharacterized repeat protein (TIGR03803 family)
LYSTTSDYAGPGTVFVMKRHNNAWILNTLHTFNGYDGRAPQAGVVFGPGGTLYGTTIYGGAAGNCFEFGCGVVYALRGPRSACRTVNCPWNESVTYPFSGYDGDQPNFVLPAFDQAGNIYGTTCEGGDFEIGNVFQLSRSGGGWIATNIHSFNIDDGACPVSGVILDAAGNVYGDAYFGTPNVYRLSPSGSGWTFTILYAFSPSQGAPIGPVTMDAAGNLYGTTLQGGSNGGGTVFKLTPSGGTWTYTELYSFTGQYGPYAGVTMDAAGNLYGTTYGEGAFGNGSVFMLTRNGNNWSYTDLHDFTGGADGANPAAGVSLDANGNLYGTTIFGGTTQGENCGHGCGVVWEISE